MKSDLFFLITNLIPYPWPSEPYTPWALPSSLTRFPTQLLGSYPSCFPGLLVFLNWSNLILPLATSPNGPPASKPCGCPFPIPSQLRALSSVRPSLPTHLQSGLLFTTSVFPITLFHFLHSIYHAQKLSSLLVDILIYYLSLPLPYPTMSTQQKLDFLSYLLQYSLHQGSARHWA